MIQRTPRRIAGPSTAKLLGQFLLAGGEPGALLARLRANYGDLFQFGASRFRYLVSSQPSFFRHVLLERADRYKKGAGLQHARWFLGNGLLTADGESWLTQRHLCNPWFQKRRVAVLDRALADIVHDDIESWFANSRGQRAGVRVPDQVQLLALSMAEVAVLGGSARESRDALAAMFDQAQRDSAARVLPHTSLLTTLRLRRRRQIKRNLCRMLEAVVPGPSAKGLSLREYLETQSRGDLGERERRFEQIITMVFAGHDTTALVLSWALMLIASNSHVAAAIREEIDHKIGLRVPVASDLEGLTYLSAVVHESMRLYPPVPVLPRQSIDSDRFGSIEIPSGTNVLLDVVGLHRNPEFWDCADEFRPERMLSVIDLTRRQRECEYVPFGGGRRLCIGKALGTLQVELALAIMLQCFDVTMRGQPLPSTSMLLTLRPSRTLNITLTARVRLRSRRA